MNLPHLFTATLPYVVGAALAAPIALAARQLALLSPLAVPQGGTRGHRRREALAQPLFRFFDPALRRLGALTKATLTRLQSVAVLRAACQRLETHQRKLLVFAGEPLGLDRYEALALTGVLALIGAVTGTFFGIADGNGHFIFIGALLGGAGFQFRLRSLRTERFSEMSRELPATIDLISLSMNAGSDFPGAIRRVIKGQKGVVTDELEHLLRAIDLGITRQGALLALQERIPVDEVRDLVRAIILAEKKGSSVREALSQQARSSRQRRSVRAEEAATRAGMLLLIPLMLLMACIMILLVAPLMISGVNL